MQREPEVYLGNILTPSEKTLIFTERLLHDDFIHNDLVSDAVIKNILVIGEAAKHIPAYIKDHYSMIEWRKIAGMRDIMIHGYFSVNYQIIWDVVTNKIPLLKNQIEQIIEDRNSGQD